VINAAALQEGKMLKAKQNALKIFVDAACSAWTKTINQPENLISTEQAFLAVHNYAVPARLLALDKHEIYSHRARLWLDEVWSGHYKTPGA